MNILVIGDKCTDIYKYGKCNRLCPEAPVPIFIQQYSKQNEGMAGNVYKNIVQFKQLYRDISVELICNTQQITKTRYIDQHTNQMLLRIDSGQQKINSINLRNSKQLKKYDAIIISDYNKGFLSTDDINYISKINPLVIIDTKKYLGQ